MLTGSSSATNVKRSLDKYIYDNLYTTENMNIDYEGVPFDDTAVSEWIQPRILSILPIHKRKGSSTQYAEETNIFFQINIFVKKSQIVVSNKCWQLRDRIVQYFKIRQDIDLNDYLVDDSNITTMRVRDIINDTSIIETDVLYQYVLAFELDYVRYTTEA